MIIYHPVVVRTRLNFDKRGKFDLTERILNQTSHILIKNLKFCKVIKSESE
jgi:hypothetical protein